MIRVATWNVLLDRWRGRVYRPRVVLSPERYRAQLDLLSCMDLDLIALNEVTATYRELVATEAWLSGYTVSPVADRGDFGNLLATRLPVREFFEIRLTRLRRPVVGADVELPGGLLRVCATHLSSKHDNHERRAHQLRELEEALRARGSADALVLGDLNFHAEAENAAIPPGYRDLWSELHGQGTNAAPPEAGYTFDVVTNPLTAELLPLRPEVGRMRLDRVLLRAPAGLAPRSMEVFGRDPVRAASQGRSPRWGPFSYLRRLLSQMGDATLGVSLGRDPDEYLRCSDHYGLVVELSDARTPG